MSFEPRCSCAKIRILVPLATLHGKGAVAKLPRSCQESNLAQNLFGNPSLTPEDQILPLFQSVASMAQARASRWRKPAGLKSIVS